MQNELELPDFELPGQTRAFDLLDWIGVNDVQVRTPLNVAIVEGLPSALQRHMRTVAIKREIEALTPLIKAAVEGRRIGYLIRVNLYAQDTGTIFSPAGSVISVVGVGLEPLDALAEAYRAPSIRGNHPAGLRDESHYFWFNERKANDGRRHLVGTSIPGMAARAFEKRAWDEARLRDLMQASYITPHPELLERVQQAAFWNRVHFERVAAVQDARKRSELGALTDRFNRAQDRFNDAYEGYQKIERQIAAHARDAAVIDAIDNVLALAKGALQEHAKRSVKGSGDTANAQISTPPPINNQTMSLWREERERIINNIKQTIVIEVRESAAFMNSTQSQLRAGWARTGVPIPEEPPFNVKLP